MNKELSKIAITKFSNGQMTSTEDSVAAEEPLEISINYLVDGAYQSKNISITMRTPGNDKELALGFLFTEGILKRVSDIKSTQQVSENSIHIIFSESTEFDLSKLDRHFYTSSSCGVCGKSSIDSLKTVKNTYSISESFKIKQDTILSLNQKVIVAQSVFERTGGLHASGLFNKDGDLLDVFEDIGRHNALDKLIGKNFHSDLLPLSESILFLSGRACYELIQKAAMAEIPMICAIGAPSSLAIELAKEFDITLIGFLKSQSFNIYNRPDRII
jgi:FdhD protein